MGWLRSVGSIKLKVSFAEYGFFYRALLQKRPIILSILLTKATPYADVRYAFKHTLKKYLFMISYTHTWLVHAQRIYTYLPVRYTLLNMYTFNEYIFINITYVMYIHIPRYYICDIYECMYKCNVYTLTQIYITYIMYIHIPNRTGTFAGRDIHKYHTSNVCYIHIPRRVKIHKFRQDNALGWSQIINSAMRLKSTCIHDVCSMY